MPVDHIDAVPVRPRAVLDLVLGAGPGRDARLFEICTHATNSCTERVQHAFPASPLTCGYFRYNHLVLERYIPH